MAKKITQRKNNTANAVSHANNKTKKTQKVNLQTIKVDGKKVRITTREKRTLNNA